jgi:hypothetical protein
MLWCKILAFLFLSVHVCADALRDLYFWDSWVEKKVGTHWHLVKAISEGAWAISVGFIGAMLWAAWKAGNLWPQAIVVLCFLLYRWGGFELAMRLFRTETSYTLEKEKSFMYLSAFNAMMFIWASLIAAFVIRN